MINLEISTERKQRSHGTQLIRRLGLLLLRGHEGYN